MRSVCFEMAEESTISGLRLQFSLGTSVASSKSTFKSVCSRAEQSYCWSWLCLQELTSPNESSITWAMTLSVLGWPLPPSWAPGHVSSSSGLPVVLIGNCSRYASRTKGTCWRVTLHHTRPEPLTLSTEVLPARCWSRRSFTLVLPTT